MSESAIQLLTVFDSLTPQEQHELLTAFIKRTGELPDSPLDEAYLVGLADNVFQMLDAEEANGGEPDAR